jgi:HPt (histidine-containing phosphotransfer) domain-containing protein
MIHRQAHNVKGASANMNAVALQEAALEMEMAGNNEDMSRISEMLDTVFLNPARSEASALNKFECRNV